MKIFCTFFLMLFININAQYYVGIEVNYRRSLDQDQDYYNIQSKITPQGYAYFYAVNKYSTGFYLRKVLPTGYNDTSFGNNGVSTSVLPLEYNLSTGAAMGTLAVNDQFIFLANKNKIAKYDVNGSLDTSFGTGGYLTVGDTSSNITGLSLNNDLSLIVYKNGTLQKVTPTGQLDAAFGSITTFGHYITDSGIIVKTSGLGSEYKKYSLSGVQDMTFGNQGIAAITGGTVYVVNTGEIFVHQNYPVEIKKYSSNGLLDTSFGNGGVALFSFPTNNPDIYYPTSSFDINGFAVDSNNNVLLYGGSYNSGVQYMKTAFIARFTSSGQPDSSFNDGSSLYYRQAAPSINSIRVLNDNTYLCINTIRQGSSAKFLGLTKYLRTMDLGNLGTKEVEQKSFSIYPNPVKDVFNIKLNSDEKLEIIEIFDTSGKLLRKSSSLSNNISHLANGVYLIKIKTNKNNYQEKIIKK